MVVCGLTELCYTLNMRILCIYYFLLCSCQAYDASRVEISDLNDDSNEKSIYSVASRTVGVRIQKAVDPEVVALLDDSDLSRFGSDDEDLEEDFVVKANLPDELEDIDLNKKLNLVENSEVNVKEIDQSNASHSQDNVVDFVEANEFRNHQLIAGEYHTDDKPRARRLLDEQFDMVWAVLSLNSIVYFVFPISESKVC